MAGMSMMDGIERRGDARTRKLKITAMWRGVELPVPLHTDSAARSSAMA
jgi:hypothetical protein